jgi:hypothetical protein
MGSVPVDNPMKAWCTKAGSKAVLVVSIDDGVLLQMHRSNPANEMS